MDRDHELLFEGIKENNQLLNEIHLELAKEISLLKLAQQKLKYYIVGVAAVCIIGLSKPELLTALLRL
jgi:hypothetical protein